MPAMVDPYGARPYRPTPDAHGEAASPGKAFSLSTRIRSVLRRAELTRALAGGADCSASDELALRARRLTSERYRRALARSLRRTITEAHKSPMTPSQVVIVQRTAVFDAEDAILTMIRRLVAPQPVEAQGMALLERILTNADRSPLYNPSEPGTLRRVIRVATEALDPYPALSHQFDLAV